MSRVDLTLGKDASGSYRARGLIDIQTLVPLEGKPENPVKTLNNSDPDGAAREH
jgi:hypothetical protein